MGSHHYLILSLILFAIGILGVLTRRNVIIILMSIELMLNAANLNFIAFSRELVDLTARRKLNLLAAERGIKIKLERFKVVTSEGHLTLSGPDGPTDLGL